MSKKREIFRQAKLKALYIKQKLTHDGITFERLKNGDGKWSINIMVDGQRIHRVVGKVSEGVTLTQVEQVLEQIKTDARHNRLKLPKGRKTHLKFADAVNKYLEKSDVEGGKNTNRKKTHFDLHLVPYFGNQTITNLNNFEIERYKKSRKDTGAKPATINRELATLSHFFNKALEWEWLDIKPCKIKMLKEDNSRMVYLTQGQCKRLLNTAKNDTNPQIYLFILIGLETAMRRMEILTLRIENIRLESQQFYLPKAKAGARVQPITNNVTQYLKKHLATLPKEQVWLFPSIGKLTTKTGYTTSIEEPFRRVVKSAGMDPKQITPHTLRHTATTHLVQAGIDIPTVQAITGHKTPSMVNRYAHQNGEHIQQAMDKLEQRYAESSKRKPITPRLHTAPKRVKTKKAVNLTPIELNPSIKWYPQGNSNPCRLREREVS